MNQQPPASSAPSPITELKGFTSSPLQHFDTLGYIMVVIMALCIFLVYRISVIVKTNPVVMLPHRQIPHLVKPDV